MPAHKAMDPASDVILAYKHNGRLLTPDHVCPSLHDLEQCMFCCVSAFRPQVLYGVASKRPSWRGMQGYPLRVIIPGYIGAQHAKRKCWR